MPEEVSTEMSLDKGSRQGLGEATPSLAKAFHSRDCSAPLTGRTWALHLSAQWKPGYHGPACQGPLHRRKIFAKDQSLQAWRGPHA